MRLKLVVHSTLNSMDQFPDILPIQGNALIILSNPWILHYVNMDRCLTLIPHCLQTLQDPRLIQRCLFICWIMALEIPTLLLHAYILTLVKIVRRKIIANQANATLNYTLVALRQITTKRTKTHELFVAMGRVKLFLEALDKIAGVTELESIVLGSSGEC